MISNEFLKTHEWKLLAAMLGVAALVRCVGLGDLPPFIDESGHLQLLNPIHPTFYQLGKILGQYIYRPVAAIATDGIFALRMLMALMGVATTAGVYLTGRALSGVAAGLCAGCLWALAPMAVFHDRLALHDPMISFFHVWSLYLLVLAMRREHVGMGVGAGVLTGLAVLVKVPMLPLAASALALGMATVPREEWGKRWRVMAAYSAGFLAAMTLLIPSMDQLLGENIVVLSGLGAESGSAEMMRVNIGKVIDWLLSYQSPIFMVATVASAAWAINRRDVVGMVLLAMFLLPVLGLAWMMNVMFARYLLVAMVPLVLLMGRAAPELAERGKAGRIGVLVCLAGLGLAWGYGNAMILTDMRNAPLPDDDYRQYVAGWPSGTGVAETVAFLQATAARPGKPLLVAVGGFGRHGNWAIRPRLAGTGIQFREGFVDSPAVLAELGLAARDYRVFIIDEPPAYELNKGVMAMAEPAPKLVFQKERVLERTGATDGALRVWEVSRRMRVRLPFVSGAPVPENEPPTMESMVNPNGMEGTKESPFFWIGAGATELVVRSGKKGMVRLEGDFRPGPSVLGKRTRELLVSTSGGHEEVLEIAPGRSELIVPVEAGRTRIQLMGMDARDVPQMKNGDGRPLLLGVEGLRIAGMAAGATPAARCAVSVTGGAYAPEKSPAGWFRWTGKEVELRVFASRTGTFVFDADYLSSVRPAKILLSLDGEPAGELPVARNQDKMKGMPPLRLRVPAGSSKLVFRSESEGVRPAGDSRILNFLVANIRARSEETGGACVVTP